MSDKSKKSELFFRHYTGVQNRLFAYILTMVHNENDAEELLQETSSLLWEHFDNFQLGTNFSAWACSIARNKVIDFVRKNKKTRPFFDTDTYSQIEQYVNSDRDDLSDRLNHLHQCVGKLKDSDRSLIVMRFQKNMAIKQMSQATGRSPDGLYKSMTRILSMLRQCIDRSMRQGEYV